MDGGERGEDEGFMRDFRRIQAVIRQLLHSMLLYLEVGIPQMLQILGPMKPCHLFRVKGT